MVVCKVQARLDGGWATHIETAHKESASFHLRVALDLPRGGGRKKPKPLDLTKATVPKGQMSVGRLLEIHKISWWPAALYFCTKPTRRRNEGPSWPVSMVDMAPCGSSSRIPLSTSPFTMNQLPCLS